MGADRAVQVAKDRDDVIVGDEVVRFRLSTRVIHWTVAGFFFACIFTGMPIWSPLFAWMSVFFGGLNVCRWLHPWLGVAFTIASVVQFVHWWRDMVLERSERDWFGPRLLKYMKYQTNDADVGKFNGGQKLLFWAVSLGAVAMLVTGFVMWFPESFPVLVREISIIGHDVVFVLFAIAIVFHIYLATTAEPGTLRSMTRGTVTRSWARLHHPRWYREITHDEKHHV